ncbi:MAG: PTS transporter subunit EIIC [Fusobacteriaceae bacterium]
MDLNTIAKEIVAHLGGSENLAVVACCMTRLRITVKDRSLVNIEGLAKGNGVMKVIEEETIQIVVGPGRSRKLMDIINGNYSIKENVATDWEENKKEIKSKQEKSKFKDILRMIANIFVPLIPAIIAAGLLNGISGYFINVYKMGGIATPLWITFMQTLGSGLFAYFAIYVGINAAKEFGATPGLGGIIGAVTISSNINIFSKALGLYNEAVPLNSILTTGKGGIIGVILGVGILAWIEKKVRKIMPDMLDTIMTPFISLTIAGALTIFIIMPVAGYVSDIIIMMLSTLIMTQGPMAVVSGFVLSALFLPLVVVGLHHGLIPFYVVQLEKFGSIALYPILAMAGAGQVGAAIALYIKAKDDYKLRDIIRGALPVGILGVGEPLIYGVTMPLGKPFVTAAIGGGLGGAFCALTGVASVAFGPSGITAIPLIVPGKIMFYVIGLFISYVAGFIITWFFGIPKEFTIE